MKISKKYILLICLYLYAILAVKANILDQTDISSKQVKVFITEDPRKAQELAKIIIETAKASKNENNLIDGYLYFAESCINFKQFQQAKIYLDSSLTLAYKGNLIKKQIQCIILTAKLGTESGNKELFISKISEATSIARKANLKEEEIKTLIISGDYQKLSGDFEGSIRSKKKALELATKIGYNSLIAESWNSIGSTYWYFSHFQEALENYYKSFIIREGLKDTIAIIGSLKNLGLVYRDLSNFEKAISQLNQALKLSDELNNYAETSEILNLLGSLHLKFNRYNEAILYYKQSLEIRANKGLLYSTASTLENLARTYIQKSLYDDAYQSLSDALKIREQLLDEASIASTLNEIGNLYNQKGNIAESLRRYLMSLKIRQRIGNNQEIAKSLTNIGITYRKLGLYKNASVYLEQARDLILEGKDPSEAAYILVNLGNLYIDQKQYNTALKVFQEALAMRKKTGDDASLARTLRNIAQVQAQIGQTNSSRDNYKVALKVYQKINDGKAIADTYNELGNLERQVGNNKVAIYYYEDALKIYDESGNFEGKALCLRKIGEQQIKINKLENAEKNIEQSIALGKDLANSTLIHYGYLAKHELYKATKNYKLALDYYTKHIRIRDSLENLKRNEKNLEAQLDLELDKKKEEIKTIEGEVQLLRHEAKLKEFEIKKQKVLKYVAIAFGILILSIAGLVFWGYRQKKRHNKLLQEKIAIVREFNEKLQISEDVLKLNVQTKDKLFSIIAHDLKSPFNGLVGLTELLNKNIDNYSQIEIKEISKHINSSSNKVLTLIDNLLNWARSQSGRLILNPEIVSIKEIIDSCVEVANITANEKNITIKTSINVTDLAFADKDTITTVFRNLISNAIKFTGNGGDISIWTNTQNDNIEIYITDTGVGMNKNEIKTLFQVDKTPSKGTNQEVGTGLGLIICKEFIEKNKGSIEVESEPNVGTTFIITLPIQISKK